MPSGCESADVVDHLRIRLVDGKTGKVVFDSDDKIPNIGFPKEPLTNCFSCGGKLRPIIYQCICCGGRFIQQEDRKTGRKLVISLPSTEEVLPSPNPSVV